MAFVPVPTIKAMVGLRRGSCKCRYVKEMSVATASLAIADILMRGREVFSLEARVEE